MIVCEKQYFIVHELPQVKTRKTRDYSIVTRSSGDEIGRIEFYPSWRQFVFAPGFGTVWSQGCIHDVFGFMATLREREHRPFADDKERVTQ